MSILAMLTGLILALAMVLGMAGEAYAASLRPSEQNLHIRFTHGISLPLGVIGLDTSNNHYYCMEAGPITDYTVGPVRLLKDDQNARRMAWILEQYRKAGARDHAAVAVIIQDHFGIGTQWAQQRESVRQQHPDIIPRAGTDMAGIGKQSGRGRCCGTHRCRGAAQRIRGGECEGIQR